MAEVGRTSPSPTAGAGLGGSGTPGLVMADFMAGGAYFDGTVEGRRSGGAGCCGTTGRGGMAGLTAGRGGTGAPGVLPPVPAGLGGMTVGMPMMVCVRAP